MWVNGKERRREDWVGLLVCSAAGLLLVVPTAAAAPWTIRLVPAVAPASWAILRVLLVLRLLPGRGTISNPKSSTLRLLPRGLLQRLRKKVGSPDEITGRKERLEKVSNESCNDTETKERERYLERRWIEQLCLTGGDALLLLMSALFASSTGHLVLLLC